jgi:hypothetical protein
MHSFLRKSAFFAHPLSGQQGVGQLKIGHIVKLFDRQLTIQRFLYGEL